MSQPASKVETQVFKLEVEQAQQRIWQDCTAIRGYQTITLREALHRILAESIHSPINVPANTNSAVDGYALRHQDIPTKGMRRLQIVGSAFAGTPFAGHLGQGQAVRIMTGAVIPAGADCVIMQEQVQVDNDQIEINSQHKAGENVRRVGEDLAAGEVALAQGKRLLPADLGLLASLGINEIRVMRRLRVAFFSTGDELRSLGEPLATGQIYDSNRYTLLGMLKALELDLIDLGVVPDDPQQLRRTLQIAAAEADAIITSGGVSVGEADYLRDIMQSLGKMHFWQIAMKPGRPLAYGRIADTPLFGLPGNPVAVMVTFYQFVQPALLKLSGVSDVHAPRSFRVRSASSFRKQGSGILRSMSEANCLVVLPKESDSIHEGDWVDVQPFEGLLH